MSRNFPTIILVFDEGKDRKVIGTAREAAQLLLKEWPIDDGEEFFTAVRTCLEVLTGDTDPEKLHDSLSRSSLMGIGAGIPKYREGETTV